MWKKLIWGRLYHAGYLGGCALLWRGQARGMGASASRAQARRAGPAPQPAQHARGRTWTSRSCFRRLGAMSTARVLPFRFLAAARYAPQWEEALEQAMLKCVAGTEKLPGKTIVLVDVSGSMTAPLSRRSEMLRTDAAYGLAVLLREIAEKVAVYSFSDDLAEVPARRGFALRDAIDALAAPQQHASLGKAVETLNRNETYDRLIVITDEQAHDRVPAPHGKGYVINVASYKNGVGYGKWTHIDGWSESVIEYIRELERSALDE